MSKLCACVGAWSVAIVMVLALGCEVSTRVECERDRDAAVQELADAARQARIEGRLYAAPLVAPDSTVCDTCSVLGTHKDPPWLWPVLGTKKDPGWIVPIVDPVPDSWEMILPGEELIRR